jgi:type IV secretion system protein VirB11
MHGSGSATVRERIIDILQASLGPCGPLLADDRLVELMVNPDGQVWVEWKGNSRCVKTEYTMPVAQRENVIRILAGRMDLICNSAAPRLSTILPDTGERFQGFVPPVVEAPCFAIRKPAVQVFTLDDYTRDGIMTVHQAVMLKHSVQTRRNVLIGGGTGTGKTTCANALLAVMAETNERICTLEDTPELQCAAPNTVKLYTKAGSVTMQQLVQDTLRMRPDRICVGEVRGVEAVDVLDAMSTGHPGGLCTVHAGSATGVLPRMEQLVRRAQIPQEVARELLGNAQPVIAYLERTPAGRILKELVSVEGYADGAYQFGVV